MSFVLELISPLEGSDVHIMPRRIGQRTKNRLAPRHSEKLEYTLYTGMNSIGIAIVSPFRYSDTTGMKPI